MDNKYAKHLEETIQEYEALIKPLVEIGLIDKTGVRDTHVGNSDYSKRIIQPWSIWLDWKLNPFEADIIKRIGRVKVDAGMSEKEQRILDFQKIVHTSTECIRQLRGNN